MLLIVLWKRKQWTADQIECRSGVQQLFSVRREDARQVEELEGTLVDKKETVHMGNVGG